MKGKTKMSFNVTAIFTAALLIIGLYIMCLFFLKPIKFILKIVLNAAFGAVMLLGINFAGGFFGISLGLNPVTSLVAGYMGVPGALLMFAIKMFL